MTNFYRADGSTICLLQFDGTIPDVFTCGISETEDREKEGRNTPSISFQALRKSSGSEKATKPYLA
jgi:hypothetical protein